jgi:hypothetical protein
VFHGVVAAKLPGLPFEHPEQLLFIAAAAQDRADPVRGPDVCGQVQVTQRGRFCEAGLAVPRVWVDQLNRHDDSLPRSVLEGLFPPGVST